MGERQAAAKSPDTFEVGCSMTGTSLRRLQQEQADCRHSISVSQGSPLFPVSTHETD